MLRTVAISLLACAASLAQDVVFMQPAGKVDTHGAEVKGGGLYRIVDGAKYRPWLENDSARRALALYRRAFAILESDGNSQKQPREYYIALVEGGNHASVGFRLQTADGRVEDHARHAFILLDPDPGRFETTILHETGHVAMHMLSGGMELPAADVCSIPHSTAALTDRMTAFSEGWAIHLETIHAHLTADPAVRRQYHLAGSSFGDAPYRELEYFRHAADLATYSQTVARYHDVRDNNFSFQSAYRTPSDYLRAQLERSRDFASVRDANQLLQSEGFYASFFFLFSIRGKELPGEAALAERQDRLLRAMRAMFVKTKPEADTPWLLRLAIEYMRLNPNEAADIAGALNDLSHGVFVDPEAAALWRDHYLAALRLDLKNLNRDGMLAARKRWTERVVKDPEALLSRLGPQVGCTVASVQVKLVAFGESAPLLVDVNTAEEGVLRVVPGMTDDLVARWTRERSRQPFRSLDDLHTRVPGSPACK